MENLPFDIETEDGHTIHGTEWRPDGDARGVIQVFHGLGEHHARYARFAAGAVERGFSVVAHDHRGHGEKAELLGHYADENGWRLLIDDALAVHDLIRSRYDAERAILLGHSMGSYVAQYYAMFYGDRISALILSASTWPSKALLYPGLLLAHIESFRVGPRGQSALLQKLGFGRFNQAFKPARTDLDWISRDEAEVDAYIADPLCGGPYSCQLWIDLMGGLLSIASDNDLSRIQSDLPILLTGGADDPVGGEKGIGDLALHYAQSMHNRFTVKMYKGGRHEMFNEINRDEFTDDVLSWIEQLPVVARA